MKDNILEKAKEFLLNKIKLEAIVLFGSYARGTQKESSDIDIAIKPDGIKIEKQQLYEIKEELENELEKDVHLINLDEVNEDFRYEILISGKNLYVKDEYIFDLYKIRCFGDYLLFSEDRKIIIDKIKNGGSLYGK